MSKYNKPNSNVLSVLVTYYTSEISGDKLLVDQNGKTPNDEGYSYPGAFCRHLEEQTGFQWQYDIKTGLPFLIEIPIYKGGFFYSSKFVPVPETKNQTEASTKRRQFLARLKSAEKTATEIALLKSRVLEPA